MAAGNSEEMVNCVDKLFTCGACYWFAEILYQEHLLSGTFLCFEYLFYQGLPQVKLNKYQYC